MGVGKRGGGGGGHRAPSHQEVIISVRVNVTTALYACLLSYDSSVMVLRKVVILWFAIAFFLNRCHGEGQASIGRWRGILLLNMSVDELVDRHVGRYVGIPQNCHL